MTTHIEKLRAILDPVTQDNFQDAITNATPDFYRGFPLQFEFRFDYNGELRNIAAIDSVRLRIWRDDERKQTALVDVTLDAVDLDATLTAATWDDGSKQHALFSLTAEQTALPLKDETSAALFWCVVEAELASGKTVILGRGQLRCVSTGAEGDITSVVAAGAYSYLYVAGADTDTGTGFTTNQAAIAGKAYIAMKFTNTVLASPAAGDFAGLWRLQDTALNAPAHGTGSPEGVVARAPGVNYVDDASSDIWIKLSGTGNTGWFRLYINTP